MHPTHRPIHAVIDVGSKSIRLLVARELSSTAFEVVDEERFDARLGEGQSDGRLTPEAMERGLFAMRAVTQVAASYGPGRLVAVGTEALRRAPNAEEFIDLVQEETGVRIRVLPAPEEAYASFLGVVNSSELNTGCVVDIGGGSLEVMHVENRRLAASLSVPLGAIYATERYLKSDPPTAKEVRALRKAVRESIDLDIQSAAVFGSGGAIRNIARMVRSRRQYPLRRLHGFAVERRELKRLVADLLARDYAERRKLSGIGAERVGTLPAAAIVVDEVMSMTGASELIVSGQGMREGTLWQEIRRDMPTVSDVRAASIAGLAAANGVNIVNAEPEVSVGLRLFDATAHLHGYGAFERDLLSSAARLAEIGMHIDYYNRDRHAEYLVHSGDLHGFSHREIVLLASMVRWSMSGSPDLSAYQPAIQDDDTARVTTLGALLGVARSVWRRTPSPVHNVEVVAHKKSIEMVIVAGGPADAEQIAVERQLRRLESTLKVPMTVTVRPL